MLELTASSEGCAKKQIGFLVTVLELNANFNTKSENSGVFVADACIQEYNLYIKNYLINDNRMWNLLLTKSGNRGRANGLKYQSIYVSRCQLADNRSCSPP